ncbi:uncharacterized protein [Anabrus simplex]|uniref:uncharacterized protein n=1 Tax=Anabrus simplex TaxID=316456 RepID=UPI0035A3538F
MSSEHETLLAVMVASGAAMIIAYLNKKKPRRYWRTELYKKRTGSELMLDMKFQSVSGQYKNFTRMSPTDFDNLLNRIGHKISRQETYLRSPISAQDRLAVTLRFLATGDSYTSLQYLFRISKQAIGRIIPEVCAALVEELAEYVKLPKTPTDWKKISSTFDTVWNIPHCVGALDGKHVVLQSPINSGSDFFNYKSYFSIVLLALVDGNYNFIFADVGCQGRISDGGVVRNSKLYKMLTENTLGLPLPEELPGRQMKLPYFFVGDSAFALSENVMKPYPGDHAPETSKRIFNYRLSRARRVVENTFGISSSVFRVLRKPMLLEPPKAEIVVMSVVVLHNYLRIHSPNLYTPVVVVVIFVLTRFTRP